MTPGSPSHLISKPLQPLLLVFLPLLLLSSAPLEADAQSLKRSVHIKDHAAYRDFVPLSAGNLTSLALRDDQAWVIHVHDDFLEPAVKRKASEVRGLVRFGLVHVDDKEALDILKFDPARYYFRSLPFGWETRKRTKFVDTEGFKEALEYAAASVPDDFLTVLKSEKDTKALLAEAVASKPSRFTVLFTVKDDKPTLLHKVLSRKLIRNFNFALMPRADSDGAMKAAGLSGVTVPVPGMAVLMVTKTGGVRSSRLTANAAGATEFAETLRFLVEFNRQFRAELPGDARAADRRVLYMSDVLDAERIIFDVDDAAVVDAGATKKVSAAAAAEDLKEEL